MLGACIHRVVALSGALACLMGVCGSSAMILVSASPLAFVLKTRQEFQSAAVGCELDVCGACSGSRIERGERTWTRTFYALRGFLTPTVQSPVHT